MQGEKLQQIINIANQADNASEIEIWTSTFRTRGELLKDKDKIVNGIVSLMNARIIPPFNECNGPGELVLQNWLNIFEDEIIGFTVINNK